MIASRTPIHHPPNQSPAYVTTWLIPLSRISSNTTPTFPKNSETGPQLNVPIFIEFGAGFRLLRVRIFSNFVSVEVTTIIVENVHVFQRLSENWKKFNTVSIAFLHWPITDMWWGVRLGNGRVYNLGSLRIPRRTENQFCYNFNNNHNPGNAIVGTTPWNSRRWAKEIKSFPREGSTTGRFV